jgi:chromatin accessibility complex protein 1
MSEKADKSSLPLSRVRTIMKSSPDVAAISQEALYLTGKATVRI